MEALVRARAPPVSRSATAPSTLTPVEARQQLRPLGVGEVIDAAIKLCFRNFGTLAATAAVIAVPLLIVIFLLDQVAFAEVASGTPRDELAIGFVGQYEQLVDYGTFIVVAVIEALLALLAYLLIIGASFRAVSQLYLGRQASARESLRFAARRVHSLLWLSVLVVIGLSLAFLALVVPGIWLTVAWSVAVPALFFEGLRGTKAIGRSFELVKNNWWRTLGALIVGFIFIGLFSLLIDAATNGLTAATEDSKQASLLIYDALAILSMVVTAPLQAAIVAVIYYDLRVRKEGFDIELLAQQLDSGDEDPGGATSPGSGPGPPESRPAGA